MSRTPFLKKLLKNLNNATDSKSLGANFKEVEDLITEIRENEKQFISYVTHQLMGPVSSIHKHSFSLLTDRELKDSHRKNAALIHDGVIKLEDLLSSYLKSDPLKHKKIEIHFEPTDIGDLLEKLIGEIDKKDAKRILLNIKSHRRIPNIFADREKTKELLSHILDNALKYSKGKIRIDLKIGKGRHARDIVISITDDGIGIPEKEKEMIFEGFYKGSNHSNKGSGLGLYISKTLAKKHNGEIWFESVENKGTIFYIALPIAK